MRKTSTLIAWVQRGMLLVDTIPPMKDRGNGAGMAIASEVECISELEQLQVDRHCVTFIGGGEEMKVWLKTAAGVISVER